MSKRYTKNILSILLCMVMVLVFAFSNAGLVMADDIDWNAKKISISTVDDLNKLAKLCHEDSWSRDKTISLEADIDLKGKTFEYIPYLAGTFNGKGHTIKNYSYEDNGYIVGFFRYVGVTGKVTNLNLAGTVSTEGDKEAIGGLCGINQGLISDCTYSGNVNGKTQTGGIAGINDASGVIRSCEMDGRIKGYYYTGGIAGENRGTIDSCTNRSKINDNSDWIEDQDSIGLELLTQIATNETSLKVESGTDTGGIAGYSTGVISGCSNKGTVGYAHTGYNIGGIVGRSDGNIISCENRGHVYGRKDIGGIVGQQEPNIQMKSTGHLSTEVTRLHEMVKKLLDDMEEANLGANEHTDALNNYANTLTDDSDDIADMSTDFVDSNIDQANQLLEEVDYVLDNMPGVLDEVQAALDKGAETTKDVKATTKDINDANDSFSDDYKNISTEAKIIYKDLNSMADEINNIAGQLTVIYEQLESAYKQIQNDLKGIQDIVTDEEGNAKDLRDLKKDDKNKIQDYIKDALGVDLPKSDGPEMKSIKASIDKLDALNTSVDKNLDILQTYMDTTQLHTSDYVKKITADVDILAEDANDIFTHLSGATSSMKAILVYINAMEDVEFKTLGDEYNNKLDDLNSDLKNITSSVDALSDFLSGYGTKVNDDLSQINDQVYVIYTIIYDDIEEASDNIANKDISSIYHDISDEIIENTVSGRCDLCNNRGAIEGDINVGGIVGAMSIDTDDQEQNAAGNISLKLNYQYTTTCIINSCINKGRIKAKKDGAGGIAGSVKIGAITACENYGKVISTEGDYIGGIAGESLGTLKDSFVLCSLEGNKNVGGIAGYGTTITNCVSMIDVLTATGRFGAIAGQLAIDSDNSSKWGGTVEKNLYVTDDIYGIDDIGYEGVAQKISYKDLLTRELLPDNFRHIHAIFIVDGDIIETNEVNYADSVGSIEYPDFPEVEGCYGVWNKPSGKKIRGNIYIEGEYHDIIKTLASENDIQVDDEDIPANVILAYIEGKFTQAAVFSVTVAHELDGVSTAGFENNKDKPYILYNVALENNTLEANDIAHTVRLYNPYKKAEVYAYSDGNWSPVDALVRGGYLQVSMNNSSTVYAVKDTELVIPIFVYIIFGIVIVIAIILIVVINIMKKRRKKTSKKDKPKKKKKK